MSVALVIQHAKQCTLLNCHLWPVWLYHVFPRYFINGTIFKKELMNIKYVFWFSLQFFSEKFHILRRIQWDSIVNCHRSFCQILIKLEYYQQISKKILKDQISQQSIQWEESYSMQMDGQTDRTKLIVKLRNFANVPSNSCDFTLWKDIWLFWSHVTLNIWSLSVSWSLSW